MMALFAIAFTAIFSPLLLLPAVPPTECTHLWGSKESTQFGGRRENDDRHHARTVW